MKHKGNEKYKQREWKRDRLKLKRKSKMRRAIKGNGYETN